MASRRDGKTPAEVAERLQVSASERGAMLVRALEGMPPCPWQHILVADAKLLLQDIQKMERVLNEQVEEERMSPENQTARQRATIKAMGV